MDIWIVSGPVRYGVAVNIFAHLYNVLQSKFLELELLGKAYLVNNLGPCRGRANLQHVRACISHTPATAVLGKFDIREVIWYLDQISSFNLRVSL